jgi:hypothetical protein
MREFYINVPVRTRWTAKYRFPNEDVVACYTTVVAEVWAEAG